MIDAAAAMAGIGPFTAEQKEMMIDGLVDQNGSCKAIRKLKLPNSVAPAFVFHPQPAVECGGSPFGHEARRAAESGSQIRPQLHRRGSRSWPSPR